MMPLDLLRSVRSRVESRGGEVLTNGVTNLGSTVRLRCPAGHGWETTVSQVLGGKECPACARRRYSIQDMRAIAKGRKGTCLSSAYRGKNEKLEWRCAKGHVWSTTPNTILAGCWCPICRLGMPSIVDMRAIAKARGGLCLSAEYRNKATPLRWRCAKGHEWSATPGHVKRGSWCPVCAGKRLTLLDMQELAKERGGACLSKRYGGSRTALRWRCSSGHVFTKLVAYVRTGAWCPACNPRSPGSIARMRQVARSRGGRCLSKAYVNSAAKLEWECADGHRWRATPGHVVHGSWCPKCAISAQMTIEDMRRLARQRGGRCLSKAYVKSRVRLSWECRQGHRFEATPMAVTKGRWCLVCKRLSNSGEI